MGCDQTGSGGGLYSIRVSFLVGLWRFKLRYAGQNESLTGQNSLLKDQVEDYRERLGLVSADKTAYSRLTNQELRKAVFEYQTKLEEFAERA